MQKIHLVGLQYLDNALYFGCRSASADYHFRLEWEAYQDKNALTHRLAASRDQVRAVYMHLLTYLTCQQDKKVYVQDMISRDSRQIKEWLVDQEGALYISGYDPRFPSSTEPTQLSKILKPDAYWRAKSCH